MSQRGRKSSARLSVVPIIPGARTPAPVELDGREPDMGCRAPLDAPGLVLAGNRPLLRAYCTECVTAELLERELREFSPRPLLFSV